MNRNDCQKCIIDPETGSLVCTEKGEFIYGDMCEKCEQEEKNDLTPLNGHIVELKIRFNTTNNSRILRLFANTKGSDLVDNRRTESRSRSYPE